MKANKIRYLGLAGFYAWAVQSESEIALTSRVKLRNQADDQRDGCYAHGG